MAISVGGIEASLDVKITPFLRALDAGEKKMDQFEKKTKDLVSSVEKIGTRLAGIGAGITAAFGLAAKAYEDNARALNRLKAVASGLGSEFLGVEKRAAPLIQSLESLGAPGGGGDDLINVLSRLLPALKDESDAFSVLELSTRLAANGIGDVEQVSNAITAALSGSADQLVRLDRSLLPIATKWDRQAEAIGKTNAEIGKSNEILEILRERARVVPELTAWQRFAVTMNQTREAVGGLAIQAFEPLFRVLTNGLRILQEFTDTGLGRIVIVGGAVAGILATVAGGALLFGTQIATGAAALKALGVSSAVLSGAMQTLGAMLLRTVALVALLELTLRSADFLNKSEEFREGVQKAFAGLATTVEKAKGLVGKGNDELAESYRRIATGQIRVGDEELKETSIKARLIGLQKELNQAVNEGNEGTKEEINFKETLRRNLEELAAAEAKQAAEELKRKNDLKAARAAEKAEREAEERQRQNLANIRAQSEGDAREKERKLRQRDLLEELALQTGGQAQVIALLEQRRVKLLADIEERRAAIGEATTEELEQLIALNEQIATLSDEQKERLKSPWDKATESAITFGEFSQSVMSSVQGIASGLAETFASTLVGGITSARQSMGQLFSQFMKQIAAMIARAVVLSAIMSVFGFGSFGGNLGKFFGKGAAPGASGSLTGASGGGLLKPGGGFFGHDDPANDQLARGEGSRIVDLLLSGMSSRAGQMGGVGDALSSSGVSSSGVGSFAPVVEVHEATEMTWVRVTDRHIEPRIRERLDRQTVRS